MGILAILLMLISHSCCPPPLSVLPLIPERYRMRARHREDSDLCGRRLAFGRVVDGVWITDTLSVGIVDKCRKYIRRGKATLRAVARAAARSCRTGIRLRQMIQ